jgi:hypothetical protein
MNTQDNYSDNLASGMQKKISNQSQLSKIQKPTYTMSQPKYKKLKAAMNIEPKNADEFNQRYLASVEYKKLAEAHFEEVCDALNNLKGGIELNLKAGNATMNLQEMEAALNIIAKVLNNIK